MVATQQGLTQTYNRLKDPDCHDADIITLRELHLELDRQVLAAYGWSDIAVPPYTTPITPADKQALSTFEDTIIDRLFALNATRAAEERATAATTPPPKKPRATKSTPKKPKPPKTSPSQLTLNPKKSGE